MRAAGRNEPRRLGCAGELAADGRPGEGTEGAADDGALDVGEQERVVPTPMPLCTSSRVCPGKAPHEALRSGNRPPSTR